MCTEMLCLRFFVVLVFVLSARALDTICTDHDCMFGSGAWLVHIAMAELTAQQVQELVHRISGLEQMHQQLQTQQTTTQNTVALLSQQLNRAQQVPSQGVARPREGTTDRKAFSTLPRYTGKVKDFDDWHFKMKQFLESEAEFLPLMMWVEQEGLELTRVAQSATVPCAELELGRACACSGEKFGGGSRDSRCQRMG